MSHEPCRLPFRPPLTKYTFSALYPGTLTFDYTGSLRGFFLFATESLNHFSFYNAWYPMGFDADSDFSVTLQHNNSKVLLNGTYDTVHAQWHYHASHQSFSDCNFLFYDPKAYPCYENDLVRMLFFNPQYQEISSMLSEKYAAIVHFYKKLYDHAPPFKRTIVFLPPDKNAPGAYIRDDLIVFGETYPDERRVLHILAHELGHAYATGADTESWEDWLNETHAEWSALLFTLDTAPDLFRQLIAELQARCEANTVSLRPDGNSRPQNTHAAGTWLYYGFYQQYGRSTIEMLLRTFDRIEIKTTACFINEVAHQSPEIAAALLHATGLDIQ